MALSLLSFEVASEIWRYTETDALVNLFCTLDKSIQRLITRRGAICFINSADSIYVPKGSLPYLLRSISDIDRLHAGNYFPTSNFAEVLQQLNPRCLRFDKNVSAISMARPALMKHPSFSINGFPDFNLLTPRIEVLEFPSNELSEVFGMSKKRSRIAAQPSQVSTTSAPSEPMLSLPPTLRSIDFGTFYGEDMLDLLKCLPSQLEVLKIRVSFHGDFGILAAATELFPSLEELSVGVQLSHATSNSLDKYDIVFPKTLSKLYLNLYKRYPTKLLSCGSSLSAKLTHVTVSMSLDGAQTDSSLPSFGSIWPACLVSMDLTLLLTKPVHSQPNPLLPPNLTTLKMTIKGCHQDALGSISQLHSLTRLTLDCSDIYVILSLPHTPPLSKTNFNHRDPHRPAFCSFSFAQIPASVTSLSLVGEVFKWLHEGEVGDLPPNLSNLSLPVVSLDWAKKFKERFPLGTLQMADFFPMWKGKEALTVLNEFRELCIPEMDLDAVVRALERRYSAQRVFFRPQYSYASPDISKEVRSLAWICPKDFGGGPLNSGSRDFPWPDVGESFPALQKLVIDATNKKTPGRLSTNAVPRSLMHLKVTRVVLVAMDPPMRLPNTLTYIASDAAYDSKHFIVTFNMFPNLKHLDTPQWNWSVQGLTKWVDKGMDRLVAHFSGLKDVEWPTFFKTKFLAKTRANMSVTISYIHTGKFIPTRGKDAMKEASVEERRAASLEYLKLALAEPMPTKAPVKKGKASQMDVTSETVGHFVTELFLDEKASIKHEK